MPKTRKNQIIWLKARPNRAKNPLMGTIPNILTLSRLAVLPLIIVCIMQGWIWGAFGLYAAAALTDYLDGWIARKLNQASAFGTFLDPIADKVFVAALLVVFTATGRLPDIWIATVIIILAREFLVSGLREYLGPKNIRVPVSNLAKWKTALQMIATGILIIGPYDTLFMDGGRWGMAIAALLTVITGWTYMKEGMKYLRG